MVEETMTHPETGETLYRDIRPVVLTNPAGIPNTETMTTEFFHRRT